MNKAKALFVLSLLVASTAVVVTAISYRSPQGMTGLPTGPDTLHVPPWFRNTSTNTQTTTSSESNSIALTPWQQQWISYARTAWQFYSPGFGVSLSTGLVYASQYFHGLTDWDLAGYIQAILAAEELGIIGVNGTWGADYRLNLVFNFLDSRILMNGTNIPYQFYNSDTGGLPSTGPSPGDPADEGRLLISLYDAKLLNPEFTNIIQSIVNRVNYAYLAKQIDTNPNDIYARYYSRGFALWGFSVPEPGGSSPPQGSQVVPEPVILSILENIATPYMLNTGQEVYFASYSLYNRTGMLTAFGEGGYPSVDNLSFPYIYESIEVPSGSNYSIVTWQGQHLNVPPAFFAKTAFAYLAIYNSTYANILVGNTTQLATSHGYSDGFIVGSGALLGTPSDNSNNMIMEAAAYSIFA
ncbi:MAG: DUF3131 domain-containing protein [Nitrososphaerales archaeon]